MAFQDFDVITNRRKEEKRRRMKKRILIATVSLLILGGIIAAAFFVVTMKSKENEEEHKAPPPPRKKPIPTGERLVKMVCNPTDYKAKCESTLSKVVKEDPKLAQPKELLKVAIKAVGDEVDKAFEKVKSMKFESDETKGAFEDCQKLIDDAKEELQSSVDSLDNLTQIFYQQRDLSSWLSAVMSYPETCADGFSDEKLKTDIKKVFEESKQLTSNSLAIASQLGSLLSLIKGSAPRRLLSSPAGDLDKDGLPTWMNHEDRRVLKAADHKPTPNVTVAKDGSGNFKTISEALAAIPAKYEGRYIIYVKEGVYDETVMVSKKMVNITMYGDGSQKSIITGSKNFVDGVRTFQTASFAVEGAGFMGKAMGFRNTAGPEKHQAVAARVQADRAIFVNCRFEGYQDTLYAQTHRQFYRSCVISGTVDFIFGDAASIFQNCILVVRKPLDNQQNIVTAQGRTDRKETTGIVLQKCEIKADDQLVPVKDKIKSYLGRPWKEFSRTIIMESKIDDFIHPDGFMPWDGDFALKTLYYAEFGNTGAGASTSARVKWPGYKTINKQQAFQFTVENFLRGSWIRGSGVPAQMRLYN